VSAVEEGRATVFLGAGLGAQAGLPNWPKLLEKLSPNDDRFTTPYNAETAPDEFEELRKQLAAEYLPRLRELLNPPGLEIPQLCRILADVPFRRIATTNVDEILFLIATVLLRKPEESIYIYPSDDIWDRNYFYLHGRLKTAGSAEDIVLRSSDYFRAYDDGEKKAERVLFHLLEAPLVFIAFSLTDFDVKKVIKFLARNQILKRQSGTMETQVFLSMPRWFAVLSDSPENLIDSPTMQKRVEQEDLAPLMRERESVLRPVKVIWYKHDTAHSRLRALLERLQSATRKPATEEEPFMAAASDIEELAALTSPTPGQIEQALNHLAAPTHRTHFFRYAAPSWLPILWDREQFRAFPQPQLDQDGNYRVSQWDAADFVHRSARAHPDTVLRMIQEIRTENWVVVYGLARALEELPADLVSKAVPSVDDWLGSRFAVASPASLALSRLLGRLVSEQEWDAALLLFEVLVKWKVTDDGA